MYVKLTIIHHLNVLGDMPLDQTKKQDADLFVSILCNINPTNIPGPCEAFEATSSYASLFEIITLCLFNFIWLYFSNIIHNLMEDEENYLSCKFRRLTIMVQGVTMTIFLWHTNYSRSLRQ